MKHFFYIAILILPTLLFAQGNDLPVDSASVLHPGVPRGELLRFTFNRSKVFPGTSRECWVYVPAQYSPDSPACVYVNQDGIQWKAPTVFDNLIDQKKMPVTIGVFVTPGKIAADSGASAVDRFNRSFEYDGLGDAYCRFLVEELLPEVEKQSTADGRPIRLSKNPADRAIGGSSSGAVCAFTVAWEHPEQFSRVFSAIGTYVGLRGADRYPTLIRKYEPKPIRVFLQDGSHDLNIYAGDWWKANETMERALAFAGYEVNHVWGDGAHDGAQGNSIFPDAMRWLWKDWPTAVKKGASANDFLHTLLIPGEDWQLVGDGYQFTEGIAANPAGEVFFQDVPAAKTYTIAPNGTVHQLSLDAEHASGTCFDSAGQRYTIAGGSKKVLKYDVRGKKIVVAQGIAGNDLARSYHGNIYVTAPNGAERPGSLMMIGPGGSTSTVDEGLRFPNGVALSPDQTQLYVTESASHWVWIYRLSANGIPTSRQRFGWLHQPDSVDNAWAEGLKCDTAGRIFVATRLGIQVLDQLGRVEAILPLPAGSGQASNLCFGGKEFDVLYVTAGSKVYRRKLSTRGANSFEAPARPSNPKL